MDTNFIDRLLTCSDCRNEFIFTAGEQIFFHDKQFKNDPKRCKGCKARRAGLPITAAGGNPAVPGLSRTETRTECSECGIDTTVPFKPTQGRPVLCRLCFQMRARALAAQEVGAQDVLSVVASNDHNALALSEASRNAGGEHLSPDRATLASASMAAASPVSSVASSADLASISAPAYVHVFSRAVLIPAELLDRSSEVRAGDFLSESADL